MEIIVTIIFIIFALANYFLLEKVFNSFSDEGLLWVLKIVIGFVWFVLYLIVIRKLQDAGVPIPYG